MLQRFYIQKNSNFINEYLLRIALPEGVKCPVNIREIIEINGTLNERTLAALKKQLCFSFCAEISTEESGESQKLIVMQNVGRADRTAQEIQSVIKALEHNAICRVRIGKEYIFDSFVTDEAIEEFAEKTVNHLTESIGFEEYDVENSERYTHQYQIIEGFNSAQYTEFTELKAKYGIKMDIDDLMCVQNYFLSESREPSLAELRIIDSFFSENFRHTTFETYLDTVLIDDDEAKKAWERYRLLRGKRKISLSDIARATAEISKDSSVVSVGKKMSGIKINSTDSENLALLIKNESHNRSTTLVPYDGAGGSVSVSVSDLLCVFGYPFETYRVSGSGYSEKNRYNSALASRGFSDYSAAIGVPCSKCTELQSNGYADKQLEICASLAVSDTDKTKALGLAKPAEGDMIFILGAKTGADGALDKNTEIGKEKLRFGEYIPIGQPGVMSALIRLFSRDDFAKLTVSVNDVGSGGIICALGEMTDGAVIKANAIPAKVNGVSSVDLLLSESLERLLVCVRKEDAEKLTALCKEENIECASIATVSANGRFTVYDEKGQRVASIKSEFLISGGAEKHLSAYVSEAEELPSCEALTVANAPLQGVNSLKKLIHNIKPDFAGAFKKSEELAYRNVSVYDKKYDATAGCGHHSLDIESEASVRLLKYKGKSVCDKEGVEICSVLSCGVAPTISHISPYKGAYLAVTDAVMKLIASGYSKEEAYLSIQEFLPEHKNNSKRLGVSVAAMLGVFEAQMNFGIRSLNGKISLGTGGKDSDSDSTITAFGLCLGDARKAVPCFFRGNGTKIVLIQPEYDKESDLPEVESQLELMAQITELIASGNVISAATVNGKCASTVMIEMCRKNACGALIAPDADVRVLFENCYGAMLLEVKEHADIPKNADVLGTVILTHNICFRDEVIELQHFQAEVTKLEDAEEDEIEPSDMVCELYGKVKSVSGAVRVLIPQSNFSGTSYETVEKFEKQGAKVTLFPLGETNQDAFAKEIASTDILWIPDGQNSYSFMSAALTHPSVESAINLLRRRRGLIYGSGSGFASLVLSGIMGLDLEKVGFFRTGKSFGNEAISLRTVSKLSPFMQECGELEYVKSFSAGSELAFKADVEYVKELAEKGQIALRYSLFDKNTSCTQRIDAVSSEDGLVFGQLSRPYRLKNSDGAEILDVISSAVKYFEAITENADESKMEKSE